MQCEFRISMRCDAMRRSSFECGFQSLNRKIPSNKSKHLLVENELKKLKTFDSSYFIGKSHLEEGTQNYLVFQPMYRYFKMIADFGLDPSLDYYDTKTRVKFNGSCLKQDKVTCNHGKVVNI